MKTRRVTVVAILAMLVGLLPGSIFAVPRSGQCMSMDLMISAYRPGLWKKEETHPVHTAGVLPGSLGRNYPTGRIMTSIII
jgi:hypothetical protein